MNVQNPSASRGIVIQAVDLVKNYGTGSNMVHALRGVNVSFERGKFTAIMGPSGSGKSTLMHTLAGLDSATSGHILFGGADLTRMDDKQLTLLRRHKIGFIFQSFNLLPMFTAEQNILMPLTLAGDKPDHAWFDLLVETLGLKQRLNHRPNELSGGQQQRVAIARSLVNEPEILLLDEPLGALDLKLRKEMQLELKRLQREMNITFIYVTHDQEEALTMSDTVVVMNGGKVQQIGTPEDIYNEPKNAFVADFIGDSNIVDGVMHRDFLVSFSGVDFPCVDRGFSREQSVQVVVRPEDIEVVSPVEGQLVGVVNDVIFKGVHFEMHVECEGREWLIHSTRACTPGETIGMRIGPNEIHIMARSEG